MIAELVILSISQYVYVAGVVTGRIAGEIVKYLYTI
jgi:hypothetical protein